MNGRLVSFKLSENSIEKLNFISQAYRISKTEFINSCINSEYDRLNGSEELREQLETLNSITEQLKNLSFNL